MRRVAGFLRDGGDPDEAAEMLVGMAEETQSFVDIAAAAADLLIQIRVNLGLVEDATDDDVLAELAELAELRDRDRLLRHYLGTIAFKIGKPTTYAALSNVHDIEHVGEGVLAELERLLGARVVDK